MTDKTISSATLKHLAEIKAAEARKRKLAVGIGSGVIVAALAVVGAVYAFKPAKVTAASDKKQIVALVASDKFETLPAAEKKQLRDALGDNREALRDLPAEQRRDAFRNMMESAMDERVERYFSLPPGKEREAELDKQIDEMQKRMSQWQNRPTTRPTSRPAGEGGPGGPGGREGNGNRAERSARRDSGNPAKRAERTEYFAAMRERAEARGIKAGGGGGGWGGRGR
jgi:hypothetical protein